MSTRSLTLIALAFTLTSACGTEPGTADTEVAERTAEPEYQFDARAYELDGFSVYAVGTICHWKEPSALHCYAEGLEVEQPNPFVEHEPIEEPLPLAEPEDNELAEKFTEVACVLCDRDPELYESACAICEVPYY